MKEPFKAIHLEKILRMVDMVLVPRRFLLFMAGGLSLLSLLTSTRQHLREPYQHAFSDLSLYSMLLTNRGGGLHSQRNITFLTGKDRNHINEAYSGMWWQTLEHFLDTDWTTGFSVMPITASMKALRPKNRARQTKDWLDLNVEHMSIFWKHFTFQANDKDIIVYQTIEETLVRYIANVKPHEIPHGSPAPETLAVLPFYAKIDSYDTPLVEKSLAATLASLWQIGIGRCLVVTSSVEEDAIVQSAFDSLQPKLKQRSVDLVIKRFDNLSAEDRKLMPKVSLQGLKLAFLGNYTKTETQSWLGKRRNWRFIYFSEPDLILHTRPSAMIAFREEMKRGGALTGHRFMPIPHQRTFPGYEILSKVVPDAGMFAMIHDVDGMAGDACCDAGKYYPSNPASPSKPQEFLPCGKSLMWWRCGFFRRKENYNNIAKAAELHHRIPHPIIRLPSGTGFPLIQNHQKVCFPAKLGACD
jgi:hypothetical protein